MKCMLTVCLLGFSVIAIAQNPYQRLLLRQDNILPVNHVQQAPLFLWGIDSCRRYYFSHFTGFDSLLVIARRYGDTAKYLRIYFSFVIDQYGLLSDAHFVRIASTRYAKSAGAKTVHWLNKELLYFEEAIRLMLGGMGFWRPALQNGAPVSCRREDYFQFWVGLKPAGN